jgi:hypothetical protein
MVLSVAATGYARLEKGIAQAVTMLANGFDFDEWSAKVETLP